MAFPQKYSRDGETRITMGDLAQRIADRVKRGDDPADVIDEEFLHGAWLDATNDIEKLRDGKLFLADVRGLIAVLAKVKG